MNVQSSEKTAKAGMSENPDYRMHRRIATTTTRLNRNYCSNMALTRVVAARLGDNRKLFSLLHKATIIRGKRGMVRDSNGTLVKANKDRFFKMEGIF